MDIKRFILTCSCHSMDKRAKESFSLLFPDTPVPEIIKGRDRLYKFAKAVGNDHLVAISKLSGKFAYYVKMDGGRIIEEGDLVKGRRIA